MKEGTIVWGEPVTWIERQELDLRSLRQMRGLFHYESTDPVPNDQLWLHHPEMQARIRRAEEEIASGRSTRTETLDEAQAFLDNLKKEPRQGTEGGMARKPSRFPFRV